MAGDDVPVCNPRNVSQATRKIFRRSLTTSAPAPALDPISAPTGLHAGLVARTC